MRRTILCTAPRKAASSTATTSRTATCRCTCSAASTFWRRGCGHRILMRAPARVEELAPTRGSYPRRMAGHPDHSAWRFGLLPGRDHGVVRGAGFGVRLRSGAQHAPGVEAVAGVAQVPASLRGDRQDIAPVPGVSVPDAGLLVPQEAGDRQGGVVEEGGQPALRGHQSAA